MVFNNSGWLAQVQEDIVDPDREIIDPHHHLWPQADMYYNVPEFLADLTSGHNVVQTVDRIISNPSARPSSWPPLQPK